MAYIQQTGSLQHTIVIHFVIKCFKVYNGSYETPYTNPKSPVHFVTGSAGCTEGTDGFVRPRPPWSAFVSSDYGYTRLRVFNRTHLYWEQVCDCLINFRVL